MEYKTPTEDLKPFVERAQQFWKYIDMDKLAPVVRGPEVPEEEMERRRAALREAERRMELFQLQNKDDTQSEQKWLD